MQKPATAQWGLRISDSDFEKLKAGFQPKDQDDKWRYYVSDTEEPITVHVARNAFGTEFYVLHVDATPGSSGAEIKSLIWETDRGCVEEEQAKQEIVMITRAVLQCQLDAAPVYE